MPDRAAGEGRGLPDAGGAGRLSVPPLPGVARVASAGACGTVARAPRGGPYGARTGPVASAASSTWHAARTYG
jgi:hypothetical protein